jgi:hypothetical protein
MEAKAIYFEQYGKGPIIYRNKLNLIKLKIKADMAQARATATI